LERSVAQAVCKGKPIARKASSYRLSICTQISAFETVMTALLLHIKGVAKKSVIFGRTTIMEHLILQSKTAASA